MEVRKFAQRALPVALTLTLGGLAACSEGDTAPTKEGEAQGELDCLPVTTIGRYFGIESVVLMETYNDSPTQPSYTCDYHDAIGVDGEGGDFSVYASVERLMESHEEGWADGVWSNSVEDALECEDCTDQEAADHEFRWLDEPSSYIVTDVLHSGGEGYHPEDMPLSIQEVNHHTEGSETICSIRREQPSINPQDRQALENSEAALIELAEEFCPSTTEPE